MPVFLVHCTREDEESTFMVIQKSLSCQASICDVSWKSRKTLDCFALWARKDEEDNLWFTIVRYTLSCLWKYERLKDVTLDERHADTELRAENTRHAIEKIRKA